MTFNQHDVKRSTWFSWDVFLIEEESCKRHPIFQGVSRFLLFYEQKYTSLSNFLVCKTFPGRPIMCDLLFWINELFEPLVQGQRCIIISSNLSLKIFLQMVWKSSLKIWGLIPKVSHTNAVEKCQKSKNFCFV